MLMYTYFLLVEAILPNTGCNPGTENSTGNFECLDQSLPSLSENCLTDFDAIVSCNLSTIVAKL